jgi:hypothetical protein
MDLKEDKVLLQATAIVKTEVLEGAKDLQGP